MGGHGHTGTGEFWLDGFARREILLVKAIKAQRAPPAQRSGKTNAPIISHGPAHTGGALTRACAAVHATVLFPSVGAREKRVFKAILYIPAPVGTSISTPHPLVLPSFIYPKS